ncbi:Thymidylate kinase [hydrothermal vent metagenome]|uniref:dTMP kinase n=1 Tax=hydrothermal vent metagenome TaxID=652676 RepID=A0A3B0QVK9_9ZZZZ
MFITFEGIEGSGKSTQMEMLAGYLERQGRKVMAVREPGGTILGERVRALLLAKEEDVIEPWSELFLYEACRAEIMVKVIAPALKDGYIVICDRFTDSTLAYQGFARGLPREIITSLNEVATQGVAPDMTILVDCPVEVGLGRALKRTAERESGGQAAEDRFEQEAVSFHDRVRTGFLELAEGNPGRIKVVDGTGEIPVIHSEICDIIMHQLAGEG